MRVVVSGGAGFIGSHIAEDLVDAGHEVVVLDDLSTGRRENVPAGAQLVELDIRDASGVEKLFADFRPDIVSHHAAQTSVSVSTREPIRDAEINIVGSLNLLCAAQQLGVRRFVFASTGGAMYGEVAEGHAATVSDPVGPLSPYACSKLAFEGYLRASGATSALDVRILRYANVYGPRQDPHGEAGVVAIFAERLIKGVGLAVFAMREIGDPGCVRDYIFVADVVAAHRKAVESDRFPVVVNVSTGIPTTTLEIAETLRGLIPSVSGIEYAGIRPGDLQRSVLEPSPILGLRPRTLTAGLGATARWFQARGQES